MHALHWDGRVLRLEGSRPIPNLKSESALVRVSVAGICATDLRIFKGYMGFTGVPGHECVGTVSDGPKRLRGKRVVAEINFGCGRCQSCARDLSRHCPDRSVMGIWNADGAFAEFVAVPSANLHIVPENLSDEEAVFAEPLAAAFEILEQVQVDPGDEVLVLGDGKLGFLCAQALKLTGARVTVLGKHQEKLALIKKTGVRVLQLEKWKPRLFDVVVEATGSQSGFALAIGAVRPRGTLVLKSTVADDHHVSLAPLVIHEITVVGSRCGPFQPALKALSEKSVSVTPVIEKTYPLKDGLEAVAHAGRTGSRKILLRVT